MKLAIHQNVIWRDKALSTWKGASAVIPITWWWVAFFIIANLMHQSLNSINFSRPIMKMCKVWRQIKRFLTASLLNDGRHNGICIPRCNAIFLALTAQKERNWTIKEIKRHLSVVNVIVIVFFFCTKKVTCFSVHFC